MLFRPGGEGAAHVGRRVLQQTIHGPRRGRGVERADHRLDRADRGRGDRQPARCRSRSAPSPRAGARPSRRRRRAAPRACPRPSTIRAQEAQDRRATASRSARPACGLARSAANRNWVRSLVPIERKSSLGQQHVEHLGERRHLEHRAVADLRRQRLAAPGEPGALLPRTDRPRLVELPGLGDHREHDVERRARRRPRAARAPAPSSARRGRARGAARASPSPDSPRAPASRCRDRAAPCRRRCRRCGRSPACRRPRRARRGRAAAGVSRCGSVAETRNWNSVRNRPMPSAPVSVERGDVVAQARH